MKICNKNFFAMYSNKELQPHSLARGEVGVSKSLGFIPCRMIMIVQSLIGIHLDAEIILDPKWFRTEILTLP